MSVVNGGTSIKWNGTELQTANRIIQLIQPFAGLNKSMSIQAVARGNKSRKTNTQHSQREIPVSVAIEADTLATLRDQVDAFHKLVYGVGNLDIDLDQQGTYRRYVAEAEEIDFITSNSMFQVKAAFNFICVDPFARDTSTSTLLSGTTLTSSGVSTAVTLGGSYSQQAPVINITINALTGGSSNTITITNPATGQAISVTREWTAAEVLQLDLFNRKVRVDGVDVDYQGPLANMYWSFGAGNIRVDDDFGSRNFSLAATNLNLYK